MRLSVRLGLAAITLAAVVYGCARDGGSPTSPGEVQRVGYRAMDSCGENVYLSQLSPVLPVWEDSIEAWLGAGLDDTPAWGPTSTTADYLGSLVPVLQQWEGAINGALASAVLDTVADFDAATTNRQDYLAGLSSLMVAWKDSLETTRGAAFLPAVPAFARDTIAPVITCPADTVIECADSAGVVVDFVVTAVDDCDPAPVVTSDPPSGSTFPVGVTTVTCTAADSLGNTSTCTFTVTVHADDEAPVITGAAASPAMVWPPNHKWVDVAVAVTATDECDSTLTCRIVEVTSNEHVNGKGDGNTEPDWIVTGDMGLKVRAERSGNGSSRVYTVRVVCTDDLGNAAETFVTVTVPHDQGKK